jgi:hypothetical protein
MLAVGDVACMENSTFNKYGTDIMGLDVLPQAVGV